MDRTGKTLAITINGVPTKSTGEHDIKDSAGTEAYTTHWTASAAKGPLCFKLETRDSRLGEPERIDLLIHRIRPDQPYQQWQSFSTVPATTEATASFTSAKGYCPSEYFLTERLRFPSLPPGEYVLRVGYWGVGNWDRQDILFSMTE